MGGYRGARFKQNTRIETDLYARRQRAVLPVWFRRKLEISSSKWVALKATCRHSEDANQVYCKQNAHVSYPYIGL